VAQRISYFSLILFALSTLNACVSIDVGKVKTQKSTIARYDSPSAPFEEVKTVHLDKKWLNRTNGNIISHLSDCQNPNEPSLENIFKGIVSEIDDVRIIHSGTVNYNFRKALHSVVEGYVDGVSTRFELMIFKKHDCTYILTYAATAKSFADNQREFNNFVKRFVVP